MAATQFAVAVGATVIGTAGSDEGVAVVQGARRARTRSITSTPGYLDEITRLTDGRGPDVILEMLANVNLDHDLTVVAPGGRVVVIGNRGRVEIDARKIMIEGRVGVRPRAVGNSRRTKSAARTSRSSPASRAAR